MQLLAAMPMFIHVGAPDSDVVLSGDALLPVVECLADQDVTEQPLAIKDLKLIFTSDCQDLRVGERATKRRRTAGTASVLEHVNGAQRGARADRQADVFQGEDGDVPTPAGPLPKGWKIFLRVIGDGRRCKFLYVCLAQTKCGNIFIVFNCFVFCVRFRQSVRVTVWKDLSELREGEATLGAGEAVWEEILGS